MVRGLLLFYDTSVMPRELIAEADDTVPSKTNAMYTANVYSSIMDKMEEMDIKKVMATKGDVTKLENYDKIKRAMKYSVSFLEPLNQGGKTDALETLKKAFDYLEKNKRTFTASFKVKVGGETTRMLYVAMVLATINMQFMVTDVILRQLNGEDGYDGDLDKILKRKENKEYSSVFKALDSLLESKEVLKILDKDTDGKLVAESLQDSPECDHLIDLVAENALASDEDMISEASLASIAKVAKYALTKTLHGLLGIIRPIIWGAYYAKYKLDNKIKYIVSSIDMYSETSGAKRETTLRELSKESRDIRNDVIDAQFEADKEARRQSSVDITAKL